MARAWTLEQLRNRLISQLDTNNSTHVDEDEYNDIIASAAAETWDLIIQNGMGERHVKKVVLSTVAGQLDYDMEDDTNVPDLDFYKIYQIYIDESSGQFRPLPRINPAEIQAFRPPQTSGILVDVYYIPCAPTFKDTDGAYDDSASFDGINGFEEHTIAVAGQKVKEKREEDPRSFERTAQKQEARIMRMVKTDASEPSRVVRRRRRYQDPFMLFRNNINAWSIRDGKLQFYFHYGYLP